MTSYRLRYLLSAACIPALLLFASCDDAVVNPSKKTIEFEFLFETSTENWNGGFADYPPGRTMDNYYELSFLYAQIPLGTVYKQFGLYLSGNNRNGDLFMYLKRKIDGLKAGTVYEVVFRIEYAAKVSKDAVDSIGRPGAEVWLKAGATATEPVATADSDLWRMNVDKGDRSAGGRDAIMLDAIGVSGESDDTSWRLRTLENAAPFEATADDTGSLWVMIGTDSAYAGTTSLYYNAVRITFTEK